MIIYFIHLKYILSVFYKIKIYININFKTKIMKLHYFLIGNLVCLFTFLGSGLFCAQVGINTTTPSATLHVNGNTKVTSIATIGTNSTIDSVAVYGAGGELMKADLETLSLARIERKIRVFATKGTAQSIPHNTSTKVTGWTTTQSENAGTSWNETTGEFTVPVTGWYRVTATLTYEKGNITAGFEYNVQVRRNDAQPPVASLPHFTEATTTGTIAINTGLLTSIIKCVAGDRISVYTFQNQGTARPLITTGNASLSTVIIEQL